MNGVLLRTRRGISALYISAGHREKNAWVLWLVVRLPFDPRMSVSKFRIPAKLLSHPTNVRFHGPVRAQAFPRMPVVAQLILTQD